MRPDWETLSSETHFSDAHVRVATVTVRTPMKPKARRWTVVHRKCAVVIAPITADGKIVLVRQERIPIGTEIWEVPAGQVDESGEVTSGVTRAVAMRELREETGFELCEEGKLIALGDYFSSPGFTDEHAFFFVARPVQLNLEGPAHDESESILDCRAFTPAAIAQMVVDNEIRDGNTLSIFARLIAHGLLSFTTR